MAIYKGVTQATKKDGTIYYRASITIQSKHVSLGSYSTASVAANAYREAIQILQEDKYNIEDYNSDFALAFDKFVILINYRNSGIYFKTPILLQRHFFYYYLSPKKYLIFDRDDLFFYANHKIQIRGGYYFICDYGSQYNILSRYGIKNYAKKGIDYLFMNQNDNDFRYENIKIINEFNGVSSIEKDGVTIYESYIHVNGSILIGRYDDVIVAAIAYNKAVNTLHEKGFLRQYTKNYITTLTTSEYIQIYNSINISKHITNFCLTTE